VVLNRTEPNFGNTRHDHEEELSVCQNLTPKLKLNPIHWTTKMLRKDPVELGHKTAAAHQNKSKRKDLLQR
jgi:hypothetical protein